MKTFKQLIAEVAEPKSDDELNFKQKHAIEVIDHPVSMETQHSAKKVSKPRRADYTDDEDDVVYEASKMDPVGQEDGDIDNDGDKDSSDEYLHARRKAIAKAMKEAAEKKLDPVGKADADIDNDGDTDSSDEYLHARRKAIAKAMKKEAATSPYAIGMASAMKQTGDKPPLKKSTITKAHKIAKSIMKDESAKLTEANEKKIIAGINAGDSIDVIVQNNLNKRGDNKDEILKVIRDYNWKKRMKKEELERIVEANSNIISDRDLEKMAKAKTAVYWDDKGFDKVANDKFFYIPILDKNKKMLGAYKANANDSDQEYSYLDSMLKNLKEDVKQIDEVSKNKLKNYMDAARKDMRNRYYDDSPESDKKFANRSKGIEKALDKRDANSKAKVPATESFELTEAFKAGAVKLEDGSSVIIKEQDAKLLNKLVNELSDKNKDAMMKTAMKNKKGFNEILSFAKEAL